MKVTYANVMSTIAVFLAASTGGAYAANTLGRDVVRSTNIKNGQVTLADLHPTVRKRLAAQSGTGGATGSWMKSYQNSSHLSSQSTVPVERIEMGGRAKASLRLRGSVTNHSNQAVSWSVFIKGKGGYTIHCGSPTTDGMPTLLQPGQTATLNHCSAFPDQPASSYVGSTLGGAATGSDGAEVLNAITATVKVEYRA